jgi:hypothetical protein
VYLITKVRKVKKQALLEVNIGGAKLDQMVLLSAKRLTEAIHGLDFLINYEAEISFPERRITLIVNEEVFNFEFTGAKETSAKRFCQLGLMSFHSQTQHPPTAVKKDHCYTKNFAMEGGEDSVQDRKRETGTRMEDNDFLLEDDKDSECLLNDDKL